MAIVSFRNSGRNHVGVTDRLHLVHVVLLQADVEHVVQLVQHVDNLNKNILLLKILFELNKKFLRQCYCFLNLGPSKRDPLRLKKNLMRGALRGQGSEADDVAEEDGDAVEGLRLRNLSSFHLSQDLPRQKISQKFFRFLLLLTVNFNSLVVHFREPANQNC